MGFLKSSSGGTANVAKEIRIGVSFVSVTKKSFFLAFLFRKSICFRLT